MKKAIKIFLGISLKTLILVFIVFLLFLASLFFREQKLPQCIVERVTACFSTDDVIVDCGSAFFGFRHGVRLTDFSVYDRRRQDSLASPLVKARSVHCNFLRRRIWVHGVEYHRLPDSYYDPRPSLAPPAPAFFEIPDLDDVTVVLESPEILGLAPDRVSFKVKTFPVQRRIVLDDVEIVLPGKDCDTVLHGFATLDLETQKIKSSVRGAATQRQIRPFLEVLDIRCALPYMDAFTDIPAPVKAEADIEVDLYSGSFSLLLDLDVRKMGKYNSVPMGHAKGGIYFHSKVDDGVRRVALKVNIPEAADNDGRELTGWLTVDDFSGDFKLNYDVKSAIALDDALKIADFMDPEFLDFIDFTEPPCITVKGTTGTSAETIGFNDLTGTFEAGAGVLDGFKFAAVKGDYSLKGDVFSLATEMTGTSGGKSKFRTSVFCEKFQDDKAHFALKGTYRDGSLEELSEALSFDLGERKGAVDIDLDIKGAVVTNVWETVSGNGRVKISNGHLGRMKLFAGLTELMASRIPGVSFLVDQTQASGDFTFDKGVFRSENVYIEGGLVSIKGWGTYDIAKDNLDFTSRVQFLKKETVAGAIIHHLTYPLTKLLLEFKLIGPIDNPDWEYIQILDRIF